MINARNSDPESSHLAGAEIEATGMASVQRTLALNAVKEHEGLTSLEIAKATGLDRYMLARRLPEIRILRQGTMKVCNISKRRSVTWWLA